MARPRRRPPPPGAALPPDARRPLQGVFPGFVAPYGVAVALGGAAVVVANSGADTLHLYAPATGAVSYLAGAKGPGGVDGVGSAAVLSGTGQLAASALWPDIVYLAESNFNRVRVVNVTSRNVSTLCGVGSTSAYGFADGPAPLARLAHPEGVAVVPLSGALPPDPAAGEVIYITENAAPSFRVRACYANGTIASVAGSATAAATDAALPLAAFFYPRGISALNASLLYVADTPVHKIRLINFASGVVVTAAGSGSVGATDGAAPAATFNNPRSLCAHGASGAVYIVDTGNQRLRLLLNGAVTTAAGGGAVDASGGAVTFSSPLGCALDAPAGALYITDSCGSCLSGHMHQAGHHIKQPRWQPVNYCHCQLDIE